MKTPRYLIIHHTGGTQSDPLADTSHHTFEDVNAWHRTDPDVWLGFYSALGYSIGYHYFIDKTGKVTQGRKDWEQAAHCKGYNNNPWDADSHAAIGICLAGNFDVTYPTKEQEVSLKKLLKEKMAEYAIPADRIVPHRTFANKTCYGRKLATDWASILTQDESKPADPIVTTCLAQEKVIEEQRSIISNLKALISSLIAMFRRA